MICISRMALWARDSADAHIFQIERKLCSNLLIVKIYFNILLYSIDVIVFSPSLRLVDARDIQYKYYIVAIILVVTLFSVLS